MWLKNGPMDTSRWRKKYKDKIGQIQKTLHSWWKRKIAYPVGEFDDYMKHIFREHNQEADHLANLGTEGQQRSQLKRLRWHAVPKLAVVASPQR